MYLQVVVNLFDRVQRRFLNYGKLQKWKILNYHFFFFSFFFSQKPILRRKTTSCDLLTTFVLNSLCPLANLSIEGASLIYLLVVLFGRVRRRTHDHGKLQKWKKLPSCASTCTLSFRPNLILLKYKKIQIKFI